ncbi:MAG TPA: Ig-like domain-containing protein [Acidimicrobiales bacterium]|nr:Ig-like domain-containing protein [Acidimicrobiales bacterium]
MKKPSWGKRIAVAATIVGSLLAITPAARAGQSVDRSSSVLPTPVATSATGSVYRPSTQLIWDLAFRINEERISRGLPIMDQAVVMKRDGTAEYFGSGLQQAQQYAQTLATNGGSATNDTSSWGSNYYGAREWVLGPGPNDTAAAFNAFMANSSARQSLLNQYNRSMEVGVACRANAGTMSHYWVIRVAGWSASDESNAPGQATPSATVSKGGGNTWRCANTAAGGTDSAASTASTANIGPEACAITDPQGTNYQRPPSEVASSPNVNSQYASAAPCNIGSARPQPYSRTTTFGGGWDCYWTGSYTSSSTNTNTRDSNDVTNCFDNGKGSGSGPYPGSSPPSSGPVTPYDAYGSAVCTNGRPTATLSAPITSQSGNYGRAMALNYWRSGLVTISYPTTEYDRDCIVRPYWLPPIAANDTGMATASNTSPQTQDTKVNDDSYGLGLLRWSITSTTAPAGDCVTIGSPGASGGSCPISATPGVVTYQPANSTNGSFSATYQVCNVFGCASATVALNATATAINPTVRPDTYDVTSNAPITMDVLANDSVGSGSWASGTPNVSGTTPSGVTDNGSTFSYDPPDNTPFSNFTFNYQACNTNGLCGINTVTVRDARPIPTLANDTFNITAASTTLDVLSNDTSNSGSGWGSSSVAPAQTAGLPSGVSKSGSTFVFTAPQGDFADISFSYNACNGQGGCSTTAATVTIHDSRTRPTLTNDTYNVTGSGTFNMPVLNNDASNASGWWSTAPTINGATPSGIAKSGSQFTYSIPAGTFADFTFNYDACNDTGKCNAAPATVTVHDARNTPTLVDDSYSVTAGGTLNMPVLSNDSHNASGWAASAPTANGALPSGVTKSGTQFTYTIPSGPFGTITFRYDACNSNNNCDSTPATVTITDNRPKPTLVNDSYTVTANGTLNMPVLSNDTHNGSGWDATSPNAAGALPPGVTDAGTQFTYTVPSGAFATFSFQYNACNAAGFCNATPATVTVTDGRVPTLVNDTYDVTSNAAMSLPVLSNDADNGGGWDANAPQPSGSLPSGVTKTGSTFSYDPPDNASFSNFTFQYTACNAAGRCAASPATVTIRDARPRPTLQNDSYTITAATTNLSVLTNDTSNSTNGWDANAPQPTAALPAGVTKSGSQFVFTAPSTTSAFATFTFQYTACNAQGGCANSPATVTITDGRSFPTVANDSYTATTNAAISMPVLSNDTANNSSGWNANSPTIVGATPSGVTKSGSQFSFDPPDNTPFSTFTFQYTACNAANACAGNATVTVTDGRPVPTVVADSRTVTSDSFSIDVLTNDNPNVPGGWNTSTLSAPGFTGPGSISPSANNLVYTAPYGPFSSFSFTYRICNASGGCGQNTVTLTDGRVGPNAVSDTFWVDPSAGATNLDVLANDTPGSGTAISPSTLQPTTPQSAGGFALAPTPSGSTYLMRYNVNGTPTLGFSDSFTYRICNQSGICSTGSVTINDARVANRPRPT